MTSIEFASKINLLPPSASEFIFKLKADGFGESFAELLLKRFVLKRSTKTKKIGFNNEILKMYEEYNLSLFKPFEEMGFLAELEMTNDELFIFGFSYDFSLATHETNRKVWALSEGKAWEIAPSDFAFLDILYLITGWEKRNFGNNQKLLQELPLLLQKIKFIVSESRIEFYEFILEDLLFD